MLLLAFYVPENAKEQVKQALFEAGAGEIGEYKNCCFEYKGLGQFLGGAGSNPHIGKPQVLEITEETKIELVLKKELKEVVKKALFQSHPYEEPAYHFIEILT